MVTILHPHSYFKLISILEYTIHNWPVPVANEPYLDEIKSSHDVQEIPAYDIRNNLIHPTEYEEKLGGAIARVCFSIAHYTVKQKHIFNALVRDITVLRAPTTKIGRAHV